MIYKKLLAIQGELKAPKNSFNSFGKYKYRSCEDILEALKPILIKNDVCQIISDEIIGVDGRNYLKSTVTIYDDEGNSLSSCGLAREAAAKKGMDECQVTGAASSYARKYALNGLYCIDDTKDADSQPPAAPKPKKQSVVVDRETIDRIAAVKTVKELTDLKEIFKKAGKFSDQIKGLLTKRHGEISGGQSTKTN